MRNYLNKFIYSLGIFLLLFVMNCKQKEHLPVQTMSKILLKMHIAESYAQLLPKENTTVMSKNMDSLKKFDAAIYKEFHINKEEFDRSLDYYKSNPQLLDSIYQIIMNEIAIMHTNQ